MPRVEPTIGSFDLDYDDPESDAAHAAAKVRRTRRAMRTWSMTLLLFAVLFAVCYGAAWYANALPEQFRPGSPQLFARVLVIAGFGVVLGAQVIGSLVLFRYSVGHGVLTLLFPGYLLIGLKRSGIYWHVMGPWCAGILMVIAGTLLLS